MSMTADELIEAVADACYWPATNRPRSTAEILRIADRKILERVWPKAVAAQADYYVCTIDHEIVDTYSRYRLPMRLYGPIRDVLWVGDDPDDEISIPSIDLDGLGHARIGHSRSGFHHFIDGDYVGLTPKPDATEGTLRIRYFRSPSKLVLAAAATTLTAADFETDPLAFSVASVAEFAEGDDVDIVNQGNAHMLLVEDATIDDISGLVITVAETLLGSGAQVGDHVAPAGYTPVVQVPDFMLPWLVLEVATACVFNEPDEARRLRAEADDAERACMPVTTPRSYADPVVMVDRNNPLRRRAG